MPSQQLQTLPSIGEGARHLFLPCPITLTRQCQRGYTSTMKNHLRHSFTPALHMTL